MTRPLLAALAYRQLLAARRRQAQVVNMSDFELQGIPDPQSDAITLLWHGSWYYADQATGGRSLGMTAKGQALARPAGVADKDIITIAEDIYEK